MAYDLTQLKLKGIPFTEFISIEIKQSVGQHGTLTINAYGKETFSIEDITALQPVILYKKGQKESKNLFCGVLTKISMQAEKGHSIIYLQAKSYSYLMDFEKKSRTFQKTSMTYSELMRQILKEYEKADCLITMKDKQLEQIAVQYQETDWEFLKRICSLIYLPLAADVRIPAIRIYAGVPKLSEQIKSYHLLSTAMNYYQYDYLKECGYSLKTTDGLTCTIKKHGYACLYSQVTHHKIDLRVSSVVSYISKGLMESEITIQPPNGIAEIPHFPMHLIGLALEGKVLAVKGNEVKLHLNIDRDASSAVYWFPYSTPSASQDGSGWYCMPEKGDRLRVYFPTKFMKDVIAISAVSCYEAGKAKDRMGNPDNKYLRSPSGQELNLGTDGIHIASAGETANLTIGNDGAILSSGVNISLTAEDSITILGKTAVKLHDKSGAAYKCTMGGEVGLYETGELVMKGIHVMID